jgi:crotonobetainyl-CoA:carnitine CoA-transferase CaiB-like acyl-CoA transferase
MGLVVNTASLTEEIDPIFATQDLAYWARELDLANIIWAPVATMPEMIADPQVMEMGWITQVAHDGHEFEVLDTPFKVRGTDTGARGPAPAIGQHTFDVLAQFGIEGDELDCYATAGVFG